MNPATETYFFSTTISGNGVLDEVFHPNQVDSPDACHQRMVECACVSGGDNG